jgi:hypothetical protein
LKKKDNVQNLLRIFSNVQNLLRIISNVQNLFRIFSNVQNLFRISSNFQNFQNLFRICSEFSVMFRIFSEFLIIFRIFRTLFRISSTKTGLFRISWLCSEVYYSICTLRHIRIEIIHGSQNECVSSFNMGWRILSSLPCLVRFYLQWISAFGILDLSFIIAYPV